MKIAGTLDNWPMIACEAHSQDVNFSNPLPLATKLGGIGGWESKNSHVSKSAYLPTVPMLEEQSWD